jgi:hypothetical protein
MDIRYSTTTIFLAIFSVPYILWLQRAWISVDLHCINAVLIPVDLHHMVNERVPGKNAWE